MSKKKKLKIELIPDPLYQNMIVSKFINHLMKDGKKSIARRILYTALEEIKKKTKKDPIEIFEIALQNVAPALEVKSKRVGGATYQVPREVKGDRKLTLAMRWIINAANSKKGRPMNERLVQEFLDAANNTGSAIKKKEDTHKMAEANRAFAHFGW